jgi:uncharacterized membrane protein
MLVIDGIWLFSMSKFYKARLGHIMSETVNFGPVIVFYFLYMFGLVVLVILPSLRAGNSLFKVFLLGALLGLVAYGTYDLTNHATLKQWPLIVTLIDLLWGAVLTGTVALISFSLTKYFS